MENKINKKVEVFIEDFKDAIRGKIIELNLENDSQTKLLEVLYSIQTLHLNKEDFMKRKRIVSSIPLTDRCIAKKANGEQCTRKKKNECSFCGTHDKYQPHGIVTLTQTDNVMRKISLTIIDVNGINYYVDDDNNVYNTADILSNSKTPGIIAKLERCGNILEIKTL
tara:strand:+ start:6407 stop:6907 length:501 start_codon:yes stop_codon:yes gene_type:complete